ncbi:MAG: glycosyltransferase family 1 protein [Verrucomicrobiota bacterium]|nr:glycosyltransferase family 1 protein [Verrucomicrobiota bacterium]
MKICSDARMINSSGIGRFIRSLFRGLNERSYEIDALGQAKALGAFRLSLHTPEIFNIVDWEAPIYSLREQFDFKKFTPYIDSHLIHAPVVNYPTFAAAPDLVTVYDFIPLEFPEHYNRLKLAMYRINCSRVFRRVKLIHCISSFTRERLCHFFPEVREKARVVQLGMEPAFLNRVSQPAQTPDGFFLYVGNLKPHKNLKTLLSAFSKLIQETKVRLVIVGKDYSDGQLQRIIDALNLGDYVQLTGEVPDTQLQLLYEKCIALVVPSFVEGFGYPPLEAMCSRAPVICSKAGSLPEVCGDAAAYFDPHSPQELTSLLKQMVHDPLFRKNLQENGARRVLQFPVANTVSGIAQLYEELRP